MTKHGQLMAGKRGLVMGVANHNSIAWGMAEALHRQGAELAFTYQGEAFGRRVQPLAATLGRSEEHTSELQSLMRISYAVFCLKKKTIILNIHSVTSLQTKKP